MRSIRLFIILSIFLCTELFSNAASTDKNFDFVGEEETVVSEARTTLPVEAFERPLNRTRRYSTIDSRNITRKDVKSERRKREVVTDDSTLPGFAIYDAPISEDEKLLKHESHVTKKRGKRRRHRRCKKRSGCPRSGNRNNNNRKKKLNDRKKKNDNEDIRIIIPVEPRKWFQYQSRGNRNFQARVLVGNRPLALFRQQLAAAAAADAIKSSTTLTDRSIDSSSKKFNDFSIDAVFAPKFSEKHKNKRTKEKSGKKHDKKMKKNKDEKMDDDKIVTVMPEFSSVKNVSEHQRNSSVIEDTDRSDVINYEQQPIVVKRVPRTKSMETK